MKKKSNIICILILLIIFSCNHKKSGESKIQKPNVLFIFADDQRADALGCSGNKQIKTPHIDAIAAQGVQFRNAYVMGGHHGAICAPSRAMLMSGKSLYHVYDVLDSVYTMPHHFAKQGGYETFGTGKWHNSAASFEATFQKGKNVFIGGMSDHFNVPCKDLVNGKLSRSVRKSFSTDLFADAATDFLVEYSNSERKNPFFCYLSFTAPHDPRSPSEKYIGKYPVDSLKVPGNFLPYHPFYFADFGIRDETLAAWPRTKEDIKSSLADYYSMISHVDDRVGKLIQLLKNKGMYDKTIIVYAADNGLAIGSHGLLGKQNLYEHSTNVPLIIAGPGIPKGIKSDALVYLFDIFPSLSSLCGLPDPVGIDGENFNPIINGKSKGRTSLFTTYANSVRAVRTDDWKLIRYPKRDFTQLFNLEDDPLETNNLSGENAYTDKVEELRSLLSDWQDQVNDTVPLTANKILPMHYDPKELERKRSPDRHQPKYVLDRYFNKHK